MSDEKSNIMKNNINKRTKGCLLFYLFIIIFIIWSDSILSFINNIDFSSKDSFELSKNITFTFVSLITTISLPILFLNRNIELHKLADKYIFKVGNNVGKIIHDEMVKAAIIVGVTTSEVEKMQNDFNSVRHTFYYFINQQEVQRDIAFTRWEQYYTNIYVIMYGLICILISMVLVILRQKFDIISFIPFIPLALVMLVYINTFKILVKDIYDLPKQQIEEVYTSKATELKLQISSRFGSKIIL